MLWMQAGGHNDFRGGQGFGSHRANWRKVGAMTLRDDVHDMRKGLTLTEIGVIVSLVISVGTVLFTGGIVYAQVQEHGTSIAELQTKDASTTDRLARIETKIDLMLQRGRAGE